MTWTTKSCCRRFGTMLETRGAKGLDHKGPVRRGHPWRLGTRRSRFGTRARPSPIPAAEHSSLAELKPAMGRASAFRRGAQGFVSGRFTGGNRPFALRFHPIRPSLTVPGGSSDLRCVVPTREGGAPPRATRTADRSRLEGARETSDGRRLSPSAATPHTRQANLSNRGPLRPVGQFPVRPEASFSGPKPPPEGTISLRKIPLRRFAYRHYRAFCLAEPQ